MTIKNRLTKLEKTNRVKGLHPDDTIEVCIVVHDDSTGLDGVEMTRAEYAEYTKSKTGTVITIMERTAENDD